MLPRIEMYSFQKIMNRALVKQYSRHILMIFASAKFKYIFHGNNYRFKILLNIWHLNMKNVYEMITIYCQTCFCLIVQRAKHSNICHEIEWFFSLKLCETLIVIVFVFWLSNHTHSVKNVVQSHRTHLAKIQQRPPLILWV